MSHVSMCESNRRGKISGQLTDKTGVFKGPSSVLNLPMIHIRQTQEEHGEDGEVVGTERK